MPSGTTSGRLPTGGVPTAGFSTTAGPTCQWFSPGQLTCEVRRKVDSRSSGWRSRTSHTAKPRLSVLWTWTAQAEVRQSLPGAGGGTGRPAPGPAGLAHLGVSSWLTKTGPFSVSLEFCPASLPVSCRHGHLSRLEAACTPASSPEAASPQTLLPATLSHPNSPTCRLPLPPFPAAFLGPNPGPTLPTFMFLLQLTQRCTLLARGWRIPGALQHSSAPGILEGCGCQRHPGQFPAGQVVRSSKTPG